MCIDCHPYSVPQRYAVDTDSDNMSRSEDTQEDPDYSHIW